MQSRLKATKDTPCVCVPGELHTTYVDFLGFCDLMGVDPYGIFPLNVLNRIILTRGKFKLVDHPAENEYGSTFGALHMRRLKVAIFLNFLNVARPRFSTNNWSVIEPASFMGTMQNLYKVAFAATKLSESYSKMLQYGQPELDCYCTNLESIYDVDDTVTGHVTRDYTLLCNLLKNIFEPSSDGIHLEEYLILLLEFGKFMNVDTATVSALFNYTWNKFINPQ